jgi:hypothetical protein
LSSRSWGSIPSLLSGFITIVGGVHITHHEHVQATTTFQSEEVLEEIFCEPILEDPLKKSFAQFECDLDIDMIHEQAKALLDPTPEMRTENGEEEMEE